MKKKSSVLLILTAAAAVLAVLSIVAFTLLNQKNISSNNREYLHDNTAQMAALVNDSLAHGLTNIQALGDLAGEVLTSPELDVATLQRVLNDSIFNFVEFTDKEGRNHNIAGTVTDAGDRQYYLDAMEGRAGIELIFDSRATGETLLVFYAPVRYQGEIIGSLIGAYQETTQLDKLLTMDVFGYRAEAYLCNEDGLVIASNQRIDTTARVPIQSVLGPRAAEHADGADFLYRGETAFVPLEGNETGACLMGLEHGGWYIVQIFPEQASAVMVRNANRIGILLAVFLVSILAILLLLTWRILNRSRQETQKALVRAEAASKAKTDFLFSMSHDIRTPMNAIIGFLRLLDGQQADPERREEYIHKIEDASKLLLSIINNVLEMSQIEGGNAALEESAWSAEQMLDAGASLVAERMADKGLTFETSLDVAHPFVFCDMAKLQEVYLNILNNACQYTPAGGRVSMRITEEPAEETNRVLYRTEIRDSGVGIAPEFMPHLFEAFTREQDTTHSKIVGTGLGLTIAKRLTDLMGGTIAVESMPGAGTTVTVTIPHRVAAETELCQHKAAPAGFSDKRILLAEDNELNAEIASVLLSEMGFEVDWAPDGEICVAMLDQAAVGHYDLILMDIQMPNMNGYQAAEAIRKMADPAKASIPIIAMTANAFTEDKENAFAAGMNAHLAKPVDIDKLIERLADFL